MNTGAARIPTVLEMTEDNISFLGIWGEKKIGFQFILQILNSIPSRMCWENNGCKTSQVMKKQIENTGNNPESDQYPATLNMSH